MDISRRCAATFLVVVDALGVARWRFHFGFSFCVIHPLTRPCDCFVSFAQLRKCANDRNPVSPRMTETQIVQYYKCDRAG
jgi:hypothetical protein